MLICPDVLFMTTNEPPGIALQVVRKMGIARTAEIEARAVPRAQLLPTRRERSCRAARRGVYVASRHAPKTRTRSGVRRNSRPTVKAALTCPSGVVAIQSSRPLNETRFWPPPWTDTSHGRLPLRRSRRLKQSVGKATWLKARRSTSFKTVSRAAPSANPWADLARAALDRVSGGSVDI